MTRSSSLATRPTAERVAPHARTRARQSHPAVELPVVAESGREDGPTPLRIGWAAGPGGGGLRDLTERPASRARARDDPSLAALVDTRHPAEHRIGRGTRRRWPPER